MKSILISSNSSGGGKTTITVGLMKALMKKGFDVQGYKVGPDYIDPAFHAKITGKSSRNLDLYLMGEEGVKASYSRGEGDLGVVEGVMGLYDGKGIDSTYSTAHVAKILGLPVVLVLSPKAQSATLCAEINGLINFDNINIVGVILNNVSESYYNLLKATIEYNCKIKVFGYVPKDERLILESRHLGLIQSSEIDDLDDKIDICSDLILKNVDIDGLLQCFKDLPKYEDNYHLENKGFKIGVAYDKAFSFYYKENLELLSEVGEIVYFSPLSGSTLPENLDFLYIGGGYPEVFLEQLSANKSMIKSIKDALDNGLKCYAECGGLMYLTKAIDNGDMECSTVGFFSGKATMTKKLQNFGYAEIEIDKDNEILSKGTRIKCHEFHKSCVSTEDSKIYKVKKTMYDGKEKQWECGYIKNNTVAGYAHLHFFGNIDFLKQLLGYR
ncbi:cobyrinic acid a,c-diamide synthase [Clostridium tetanomorphum]|uniref:Cobyrinate a,c-diamide synthase n=1 Tax=Clostridium tetanomorphum TaxID=1553 RepID=A0A923IZY5_CLOTT|nr:cobyrinate a,c-diamide synthase [Clostridium tetanomorphum]KAJ50343.1 cobyrinic acid a,c-diamide synthase [Clostridium tetanomorphum DSM 665]MBC2397766.1 cobyrinate a,c-diamide synthase [Clostridium tetanomorphum]MBP1866044.1 cobyrinic acid a,c-diamide synthase [Clostridium tetanomorphum]NRS83276.1 cobyrinic acid a,c-diamide synthase [Clostridium tetanomorphum]NRZ96480.1 cobyrinic acid a,c-diamide synthase [Clostridium tetanomorphum]